MVNMHPRHSQAFIYFFCTFAVLAHQFSGFKWVGTQTQRILSESQRSTTNNHSIISGRSIVRNDKNRSAAVVWLAPPRQVRAWGDTIERFCLLRRSIRSVDENLNGQFGPYPIIVVLASDDDSKDSLYTPEDRQLIKQWAPNTPDIIFLEIPLYSGPALERNTTVDQIHAWRQGRNGGIRGSSLGYQSMCRLWSGRLQRILQQQYGVEMYMRLDDDSLLTGPFPEDPFVHLKEDDELNYVYKRSQTDQWGISHLWRIAQRYLNTTMLGEMARREQVHGMVRWDPLPTNPLETIASYTTNNATAALGQVVYVGRQPYNNFHMSKTRAWNTTAWRAMEDAWEEEHLWFRYRVGDANVHAMFILQQLLLAEGRDDKNITTTSTARTVERAVQRWSHIPYVHNVNDDRQWISKLPDWQAECQADGTVRAE